MPKQLDKQSLSYFRGFVFTVDILIAAVITILVAAVFSQLISASSTNYLEKQQLASVGNDFLAVLYGDGTLNSYVGKSEMFVESDMENQLAILPQSYCANFTVEIYRDADNLENTYSVHSDCTNPKEVLNVKRIFIDFDKEKFGVAEVVLWLK